MSRSQKCLGKSSTGSQKQLAITSAHAGMHKPNDKVGKKTVTEKPCRTPPERVLPRSVQETQKSGFPSGEVLNTEECSPKKSINKTPRVDEQAQSTVLSGEQQQMKDLREAQPPDSAGTGGRTRAPPAVEPLPMHKANIEEEQTEEEDVEDEDIKAPVELKMEFLRAVLGRDFQLASKLCQMILIYEPDNPEASEFLPLIHKKLLDEQEAEQSNEEDEEKDEDDDDDNSDDSGSDEESSQSSSGSFSSCSSSSPSDDEEEEKWVTRHKLCPPAHISP